MIEVKSVYWSVLLHKPLSVYTSYTPFYGITASFLRLTPASARAPAPPPAPRNAVAERVRERCAEQMAALSACNDERECSAAHIGLTACIAQQVCRDEFRAFEACRGGAAEDAGMRFEAMEGCVRQWGQSQR